MPVRSPFKVCSEVTICTVADLRALGVEPTDEIKEQLLESLRDQPLITGSGVLSFIGFVKSAGWYECDGDIAAVLKAEVEVIGEVAPTFVFNRRDKATGEVPRVVVERLSLVHVRAPLVKPPMTNWERRQVEGWAEAAEKDRRGNG